MLQELKRSKAYLAMLAVFAVVLGGVIFTLRRPEPRVVALITPTPRPTATAALIQVQVSGAVNSPGLYTLPLGARLTDLLDRAGGALDTADLNKLNLARKLKDGEAITIPAKARAASNELVAAEEATPPGIETPIVARTREPMPPPTASGKVNINTAGVQDLDRLPHIGPALAQRIIDYRTQNGDFARVEDIKNVKGIGDAIYEDIKELITTNDE